jgi:hypothetical protein
MSKQPSYITPGHVRAFQMVTSNLYGDSITLSSCLINDAPSVAIVMVDHVGEGKVAVMPLFVAINDTMKLAFPGDSGSGGDGGPTRSTQHDFAITKDVMTGPNPG